MSSVRRPRRGRFSRGVFQARGDAERAGSRSDGRARTEEGDVIGVHFERSVSRLRRITCGKRWRRRRSGVRRNGAAGAGRLGTAEAGSRDDVPSAGRVSGRTFEAGFVSYEASVECRSRCGLWSRRAGASMSGGARRSGSSGNRRRGCPADFADFSESLDRLRPVFGSVAIFSSDACGAIFSEPIGLSHTEERSHLPHRTTARCPPSSHRHRPSRDPSRPPAAARILRARAALRRPRHPATPPVDASSHGHRRRAGVTRRLRGSGRAWASRRSAEPTRGRRPSHHPRRARSRRSRRTTRRW